MVELIALFLSVKLITGLINLTNFSNGFSIEGNAAALTLTFYQQSVDDDGNISIRPGYFDTRKSLTKAPVLTSEQHFNTITHSFTNITTCPFTKTSLPT